MFTFPHEQNSMAGTTDDDYYGDLDRIDVTEDEVAYVLQAMQRSIPGIREHRVLHAIQGVRPTLFGFGAYEDELSRDYAIVDHGESGSAPGLYSMTGGSSPRTVMRRTRRNGCAALGREEACRTRAAAAGRRFEADMPALASASGRDRRVTRSVRQAGARRRARGGDDVTRAAPHRVRLRAVLDASANVARPRASASSPTARCGCGSAWCVSGRGLRRRRPPCSRRARWMRAPMRECELPRHAGGRWRPCSAARRCRDEIHRHVTSDARPPRRSA